MTLLLKFACAEKIACLCFDNFSINYIGNVKPRHTIKYEWATHQYPLYEHVIILLSELRSAQYKLAQQLYSCLSHTCRVVHQTTMNAALHVRLKNRQEYIITKRRESRLQNTFQSQQSTRFYLITAMKRKEQKLKPPTLSVRCEITLHFRQYRLALHLESITYPCQYAGVHSHNLRQTFHGFCPDSNGTFPKDSQDLHKKKNAER